MPAKFEIDTAVNGKFIWRFKAANGEKVAQSETYESKQGCQNAIDLIKKDSSTAPVEDLTTRRF